MAEHEHPAWPEDGRYVGIEFAGHMEHMHGITLVDRLRPSDAELLWHLQTHRVPEPQITAELAALLRDTLHAGVDYGSPYIEGIVDAAIKIVERIAVVCSPPPKAALVGAPRSGVPGVSIVYEGHDPGCSFQPCSCGGRGR